MCTALKGYIEKIIMKEQMDMLLNIQPTSIKRNNKVINIYSDYNLTLGYTMVAVEDTLETDYDNTIRNVFCFGLERLQRLTTGLEEIGIKYNSLFGIHLDNCLIILSDPTRYNHENGYKFLLKVQEYKTKIYECLSKKYNKNNNLHFYDKHGGMFTLEDKLISKNIKSEERTDSNNSNIINKLVTRFKTVPTLNDLVG